MEVIFRNPHDWQVFSDLVGDLLANGLFRAVNSVRVPYEEAFTIRPPTQSVEVPCLQQANSTSMPTGHLERNVRLC